MRHDIRIFNAGFTVDFWTQLFVAQLLGSGDYSVPLIHTRPPKKT